MNSRLRFIILLSLLCSFSPVFALPDWWNASWSYRYCMVADTGAYSREDWPIEHSVNFTSVLWSEGDSLPFDPDTLRVVEHNTSTGAVIYQLPFQFDIIPGIYNETYNAAGTMVFIMNGTTPAQTNRTYCFYFDTTDNPLPAASFTTGLNYALNGDLLNVNVSAYTNDSAGLRYYIDTNREEMTSGIYYMEDFEGNNFWSTPSESERTLIYSQYSNSTANFSFTFENLTLVHAGPIRLVFEHTGNETFWNESDDQTEGRMTVRYTFYWLNQWMKVDQIYNNTATYTITRNSTEAGALAFEANRSLLNWVNDGNSTDPGSWQWTAAEFANYHVGIINAYESISNFTSVDRLGTTGKIGIELAETELSAGQAIHQTSVLHFNSIQSIKGTPSSQQVRDLSRRLISPETQTTTSYEKWKVQVQASTDHPDYNRMENVTLHLNATYDSGKLITAVNATIFYPSGSTDLVLWDNGTTPDQTADDGLFTALYSLNSTSPMGIWNVTITAYGITGNLLNQSNTSFTVHDRFTSWIDIENPIGFISRRVNATLYVSNYRNDTAFPGAGISCEWNGYNDYTLTDNGDGTYDLNFTAPNHYEVFILNCTSSLNGNYGEALENFTVLEYNTTFGVDFEFVPPGWTADNLTLYHNQTATLMASITNLGNGTAEDANFTFAIPPGWKANTTFVQLGTVALLETVFIPIQVNVTNATPAGNYLLNGTVDWLNSDNTTDSQPGQTTLVVEPNSLLDLLEEGISDSGNSGQWKSLANLTIFSWGNHPLSNVTFKVTGLDNMTFNFTPWSILDMAPGLNQTVEVWLYVPIDHERGVFEGLLNASDPGGSWDTANLTIELLETEMSVAVSPSPLQAPATLWFDFTNFTLVVNATNTGGSSAIGANLTLELPSAWATNYSSNTAPCGDVLPGQTCTQVFNLGIMQSPPDIYEVVVNASWSNPGIGTKFNTTVLEVNVTPNPLFNITNPFLNGTVYPGASTNFTGFRLVNLGNVQINSTGVSVTGFGANFSFSYDPLFSFLVTGTDTIIWVNATLAQGHPAGEYEGTLNFTSINGGYRTRPVNISVPVYRKWYLTPTNCTVAVTQDTGTVCSVTVFNTGNDDLTINITPSSKDYTYVNESSFSVSPSKSHTVLFSWDFTGVERDFYNISYNFSSPQPAFPGWQWFNITILPSEPPVIEIFTSSNITQQAFGSVVIYANITDMSKQGLADITLRVTKPGGAVEQHSMTYSQKTGNHTYFYYDNYPGNWASGLNVTGNYYFEVLVTDNLNIPGQNSTSVYVYPHLNASVVPTFGLYFAGESVSLYLKSNDNIGVKLPSNFSFTLRDPDGLLRMNLTGEILNGTYEPVPSFTFPTDAPLGNYILNLTATYYEPVIGQLLTHTYTRNLPVAESYDGDFETSVAWYPNSVMDFYLMLYTQRYIGLPDTLNLTVYDPAQNIYFTASSGFDKVSQTNNSVLYLYDHAMPPSTAAGYYLADMTVTKGGRTFKFLDSFRVSYGGPYDVVITKINGEVPQGGKLNFTVLLQNMGDVSQDVFLDYWITNSNGVVYANLSNRPAYVAAGQNRTISDVSLNVLSTQPLGTYTLHVKMRYSPLQPELETSATFQVVAPPPPVVTPEEPQILPPVIAAVIKLDIKNKFPTELFMSKGSVAYLTVEVENSGSIDLTEITAFFEGVPTSWFEVIRAIPYLAPRSKGYVVVRFSVPGSAEARTYAMKMRLISAETESYEYYKLTVFRTDLEALQARVANLNSRISQLETRAGELAASGVDVSTAISLLRKAREMVSATETYLSKDRTVEAINAIADIESTLEEVEYRLSISSPSVFRPTIPRVSLEVVLAVLAVLALLLVIALVGVKLTKTMTRERRHAVDQLNRTMKKRREVAPSSDLVELLRQQYKEGLVSRETFDELKGFLK
ncbi:MAG TPA: hypothetical protein ENN60_01330 [archaeon]|nr:hypothetical protein [archaeon]